MDAEGNGHMSESDILSVLKQVRPGVPQDELERMSAEIFEEGITRCNGNF